PKSPNDHFSLCDSLGCGRWVLNEEYRIIRPDGTIRWIWGRCFPIRDTFGQIYRIGAIAEDITDRKHTEQERDRLLQILASQNQTLETQVLERTAEFQESEKRFRNLVETSSDWIWEVNESGVYTYSSPQITAVLGYSPAEVLGKTPFDLMPMAEAKRVLKEFMNFVADQVPFQCLENTNRHKDGKLIILETSAVPIFDANGQFRGYRGMDRDITARKQTEIALWRHELRFQRIADNIPGVMYQYVLHPDGSHEFIYVSDRSQELYELEPVTIITDANNLFKLVHPEDMSSMYETISHSAQTLEQWSWEGKIITPSGRMKWIHGISQPQKQANGDILWDGLILDITDRKQIEIALRESEEFNRSIFDNNADCLKVLDLDGNIISMNQPGQNLMEIDDFAKVCGQEWEKFWVGQDQLKAIQAIETAKGGTVSRFQGFCPTAKGIPKWWDVLIAPIPDLEGNILRLVATSRDITANKEADKQLRNLSDRLNLAIKSAQIGIWDWDIVNDHLVWDERMYELYGVNSSDFLGVYQAWESGLHPDDLLFSRTAIQQAIEGEKDFEPEFRVVWTDGTIKFIKAYAIVQRDQQGKAQRMIGTNFDISQQKAVLHERELAEAEILRSRDLREAIFNESADALFLVDMETVKTLDCNERAVEMFAATNKNDLIGIKGYNLQKQPFTPEELTALNNEVETQGVWSRELEYKTFEDQLFWGNLAVKKITVAGHKMNLVRVTDISQHKLIETQLQETNQQLVASNQELARATRLKDEFLANMSHELRTPLNAILGLSEGLQDEVCGVINERQRRNLQTIERSGTHLLALINDILDLSKIEAGQVELDCTPTAMSQLCQWSLSFIKQQAFQKRIQVDVKIQPNLPDILVDERRIRQVLINLLNNAVKFTLEGGNITLTVTSKEYPPESQITHLRNFIRIAVIDTGIGIAPENIPKLFQPFVQIDSSLNRKYTGTGLGLALVKRIVEMHGGQVTINSQIGVGSSFFVDLPCANIPKSASQSVDQSQANSVCIFNNTVKKSPLILLAEDNQGNILSFSSYLEAKGYRIILAKNGLEAIEMTKSHCPDLILMDIQMPEMDGLEAIRQIRLNPVFVTLPIIALTSLAMPGDQERCLAAGANDYLSKPLKLKQLVNTMQQLLEM
ncbi:PAS domain S-box protein, partial [Dolichospermum sp. ST_sed4]|nr:PAS domain S-box protein [Dolichospermum sp. ST_sed4]